MKDLITYLGESLACFPNEVSVTETEADGCTNLVLKVAQDDLSIIIGKYGRTAKAMRSLLAAASAKTGKKYNLEIL